MNMDYTSLTANLAQIAHRSDLTAQMPGFVAAATEKINRRFNLVLVSPAAGTDTNDVLTQFPLLYVYAALVSLYEFLDNTGSAQYYAAQFNDQADLQNITQVDTVTDPWTVDGVPPAIIPL